MFQDNTKIKYFAYARKSSESEERQALSIETQQDKFKELFGDLDIIETFEESRSAFKPYNRPVFDEMIKRINQGEAQGIIAWHPDRLSRNELEAATITYMTRMGQIKDLKFGSYTFFNSPEGIMMLQMALSQSQYFSSKLGTDVKRGLEKKLKMGWKNGKANEGYLNATDEKDVKVLAVDPERFALLRKAWELMLTGNYTVPPILDILNNEWGYRTRKKKKSGGKPLSRSALYRIFTNQFYAGIITDKDGKEFDSKHQSMVNLEEFDRVQMILGRKGKPRPKNHDFAFTGFVRCGECGCLITAEVKEKLIKSKNKIKEYTYYHCTHKRKDYKCPQKSIEKDELEIQIEQELEKFTILPEFRDWALEVLRESNDKEIEDRSKIHEQQSKTLLTTQNELDNLTKMRYRDLISDEEYIKQKNPLANQINKLKEQLRDTEARAEKWLELSEKTFNFATYARKAFIMGDIQTKKEILIAIGSNPIIKNKELTVLANKWLQPIKEEYPALEQEYLGLELDKLLLDKAKTEALASVRTRWLAWRDSFRTFDWSKVFPVPELVISQVRELSALV